MTGPVVETGVVAVLIDLVVEVLRFVVTRLSRGPGSGQ